jgi:hypothetical protein
MRTSSRRTISYGLRTSWFWRQCKARRVAVAGAPTMLGEVSLEEQHMHISNARLKDELSCIYALTT